ncbi:unnamed protein product [Cylicostephanus goldi]|uniref:Uncharacterized protein n=1 Tax=Cylicostephanus goldi TaxID=71465 RepID=A0A3P7M012_CYLGO|nr:unnamed protein product [Cylicostephanus goldi]
MAQSKKMKEAGLANSGSTVSPTAIPEVSEMDEGKLLSQIQSILISKAPEVMPLSEQLLTLFRPPTRESIEDEKRSRSIVILGVPELEERQLHPSVSCIPKMR